MSVETLEAIQSNNTGQTVNLKRNLGFAAGLHLSMPLSPLTHKPRIQSSFAKLLKCIAIYQLFHILLPYSGHEIPFSWFSD